MNNIPIMAINPTDKCKECSKKTSDWIKEHDKQIRADAIDEFARLIHEDLYQLNHHQVDFLAEQLKEQK